jgi:hypothetical protein
MKMKNAGIRQEKMPIRHAFPLLLLKTKTTKEMTMMTNSLRLNPTPDTTPDLTTNQKAQNHQNAINTAKKKMIPKNVMPSVKKKKPMTIPNAQELRKNVRLLKPNLKPLLKLKKHALYLNLKKS